MKVRCYGIYRGDQEVLAEYANQSHKSFLSYELNNIARKVQKSAKIQSQSTSNGVWYYKLADSSKTTHLVLLEGSSLPTANALIAKGIEFESSRITEERIRMKLAEQMRVVNANTRVDHLSSNVMELQDIMKGNVNKIVSNMSDLEETERKSERLSHLSMDFANNSKALEDKLKRQACIRKLIIGGIGGGLIVFLIYYFFL